MNAHVAPPAGSTAIAAKVFAAKRGGRPAAPDPTSERSLKPWVAEGVSARTFYRRKAVTKAEAPPPPVQRDSHVHAWLATLGSFERLDYLAFARRCRIAMPRPATIVPVEDLYAAFAGRC